jgi:hypothetical protein
MEDLLHRYPEMLLESGLRALRGEEALGPVRLLFRDEEKKGRVVACEVPYPPVGSTAVRIAGRLKDQVRSLVHTEFPESETFEFWYICRSLPNEKRLAIERQGVVCKVISSAVFGRVAKRMGYPGAGFGEKSGGNRPGGPAREPDFGSFDGFAAGDLVLLRYVSEAGGSVNTGPFVAAITKVVDRSTAWMAHYYPDRASEHALFHFGDYQGKRILLADRWGSAPIIPLFAPDDHEDYEYVPDWVRRR